MNWKAASGIILAVVVGLSIAALTKAGSLPLEVAVIKSVQGEHERRIGSLEESDKRQAEIQAQYAKDVADIAAFVRRGK